MKENFLYTEDKIIEIVNEKLKDIPKLEVSNTINEFFTELYKTLNYSNNHVEIRLKYFGTFVYCCNNPNKTDFNLNKKDQALQRQKYRTDLNTKRMHLGKIPNRFIKKLRHNLEWKEIEEIQNKHFEKLRKKWM